MNVCVVLAVTRSPLRYQAFFSKFVCACASLYPLGCGCPLALRIYCLLRVAQKVLFKCVFSNIILPECVFTCVHSPPPPLCDKSTFKTTSSANTHTHTDLSAHSNYSAPPFGVKWTADVSPSAVSAAPPVHLSYVDGVGLCCAVQLYLQELLNQSGPDRERERERMKRLQRLEGNFNHGVCVLACV